MKVSRDGVLRDFVAKLWDDYRQKVSYAGRVEAALRAKGESWIEDHVALRSLPGTPADAAALERFFASLGYVRRDTYRFDDKKLDAFWMSPPESALSGAQPAPPKIFISQLDFSAFPEEQKRVLEKAIGRVAVAARKAPEPYPSEGLSGEEAKQEWLSAAVASVTFSEARCPLMADELQPIRAWSEYAAWTLIYGPCVNHFTVSVHLMQGFINLDSLNHYLVETLQIPLNDSGGTVIKGSPDVLLEQSATLADSQPVHFQDQTVNLPYAFIEFAWRHPLPGGHGERHSLGWQDYYQGFVAANADKIFDSTDVR